MSTLVIALGIWSSFTSMDVGIQVVVWTAVGAVVLKIAEKFLNKHAEELSDRKDYREEIKGLNERIDALEIKVESYKNLYYKSQEEAAMLRSHIITSGGVPPK